MSMFEVPGWSVEMAPVKESRATPSKKRKRPNSEQSLETNGTFDKIMEKFNRNEKKVDKKNTPRKKEKQQLKNRRKSDISHVSSMNISRPKPLRPRVSVDEDSARPAKKVKTHRDSISPPTIASTLTLAPSTASTPVLTVLQRRMKQSLDGARFRMINEMLYKSESQEAHLLMREDPNVFEEYHSGFRHQVESWPTNPVQIYITALSSYPPRTTIADLGCGDAALAKALIPRGLNVLSYDLVSDGEYVVEADVFERLPLPGSEGSGKSKTNGSAQIVDVVVCVLSLMGTNWPKCLLEAWRILKPEGELKIAEVASRFANVEEFQNLVKAIGFRSKSMDESNTHFTLFEFRKTARKPKVESEIKELLSKAHVLKPCEYKRR